MWLLEAYHEMVGASCLRSQQQISSCGCGPRQLECDSIRMSAGNSAIRLSHYSTLMSCLELHHRLPSPNTLLDTQGSYSLSQSLSS